MTFLRIENLLHSKRFTHVLFITVVCLHLLVYWLIGVVMPVINKINLLWSFAEDLNWYFKYAFTFLTQPTLVYATYGHIPANLIYLPAFLLYCVAWYVPNQFLGLTVYQALISYDFSMVLWNLGNCFLIYKIVNTGKVKAMLGGSVLSNPYILMSIYMGTSIFYIDYFVGQVNAILGFFLLLGILFYLNDKEQYAFFFWGIGMCFKVIMAIFIAVLILHGPLKRFVKNVAFLAISQIPNIILFLVYPSLLHDFIDNIFFRFGESALFTQPVSMIQFLSVFYNLDVGISYILIYCTLLPMTAYILIEYRKSLNFFDRLMIIALLSFNLLQGESAHVIITLGVYLLWIAIKAPGFHKSIHYVKLLLGFPFLSGITWVIFPYFPLIFFSAQIWFSILIVSSKKMAIDQPDLRS